MSRSSYIVRDRQVTGAEVQTFSDGSYLFQVQQLSLGKIYGMGGRDIDVTIF